VIFRAEDAGSSFYVLKSLFGGGTREISGLFGNTSDLIISFLSVLALILFEVYQYRKEKDLNENKISEVISIPLMILLVILIVFLGKFGESDFIYFKF